MWVYVWDHCSIGGFKHNPVLALWKRQPDVHVKSIFYDVMYSKNITDPPPILNSGTFFLIKIPYFNMKNSA